MDEGLRIWTIGHSTHPIGVFVGLLARQAVRTLADVRLAPGSRRQPQFGRDKLAASLAEVGIAYEHLPELGGRREPRPDSPNTAWKNDAFRGYADYMETPEFEEGLARLLRIARSSPTAMMCAEGDWRECHRGLIADALKARSVEVIHIARDGGAAPHPYTSAARIVGGRLSYAAPGLFP